MITSLHADNFRCFTNFEVKFETLTTFLGPNSAGKSACIEVLANLRDFIPGTIQTKDFLTRQTLARWDKRLIQTFELKATIEGRNNISPARTRGAAGAVIGLMMLPIRTDPLNPGSIPGGRCCVEA